jgi:hypothetical protein
MLSSVLFDATGTNNPAGLAITSHLVYYVQCVPADERWECHKNALNKAARDLLTLPTAAAATMTASSSVPAGSRSPSAEAKSSQQQRRQQQIEGAQPIEASDEAAGDVQVEALALWDLNGDDKRSTVCADY